MTLRYRPAKQEPQVTFLYHSVDDDLGSCNDTWYAQVKLDSLKEQIRFLKKQNVWVTTFGSAILYHREVHSASLYELYNQVGEGRLFEWDLIFLVFASNIIYLVIGIYIMSALFNSENVLFGDGIKGLKLFEKRANMKNGQIPGIGDLFLMFAILFIVMVYSSNLALSKLGIWGTAICQLMILLVPCLYAWYMKADLKKLFSLKMPGIVKFAGGILLFAGAFLIENVVMVYLAEIFPSMNETASSLNDMIKSAGLIPALFVVGFTPAIAEEAAFRGFLFGTLKEKYPKKIWIGISVSVGGMRSPVSYFDSNACSIPVSI